MDSIDYWKLCTEYSIVQAALLITGNDPDDQQFSVEQSARAPAGYSATRTALVHAIRNHSLKASVVEQSNDYGGSPHIDVHETTIHVLDLDQFVKARGMVCAFFERPNLQAEGEPNPSASNYPRKLDAAIKAWRAVTGEPDRLRGKSPKQALAKWLTDNAEELGLLNKDGKPNTTGIEEICKVANWRPQGGATPTPQLLPQPQLQRLPAPASRKLTGPREDFSADLDDEIPF